MTIQSNLDAAIVDVKVALDAMGFLNPGSKTEVDQDLIDEIQADMDTLVEDYQAVFSTVFGGEHAPTAEEVAHWLFDGVDPETHELGMMLSPTNTDKSVYFRSPVPFPWRS